MDKKRYVGVAVKCKNKLLLCNVDDEIIPDLVNAIDGEEHTDAKYFPIEEIRVETSGEYLCKLAEILLK